MNTNYINIQEFYDNEILYPEFVKILDKIDISNTLDYLKKNIIRNNEKNLDNNLYTAIADSLNIIFNKKIHKPNDIEKIINDKELDETNATIESKFKKISKNYKINIIVLPMLDSINPTIINYIADNSDKTLQLGYNGNRYYSLQLIPMEVNRIIQIYQNS